MTYIRKMRPRMLIDIDYVYSRGLETRQAHLQTHAAKLWQKWQEVWLANRLGQIISDDMDRCEIITNLYVPPMYKIVRTAQRTCEIVHRPSNTCI